MQTEYLPGLVEARESGGRPPPPAEAYEKIGFHGVSFSWDSFDSENTHKVEGLITRRPFRLRFDEEVVFKRGCVNLILGPTASGKVHGPSSSCPLLLT
jgi:hypothetical protein